MAVMGPDRLAKRVYDVEMEVDKEGEGQGNIWEDNDTHSHQRTNILVLLRMFSIVRTTCYIGDIVHFG